MTPSIQEDGEPIDQENDGNLIDSEHLEQTHLTYSAIKKALINNSNQIHTRYKSNEKVTPEERKLMSCGSSLILDIINKSESNLYKTLFSVNDWDKIVSYFENNLIVPAADISTNMLAKWDYGIGLAMLSNDIEESQVYFASQFAESISKKQRSMIKLFITILDVLQNNAFIMEQRHPANISEGDYVDQIWLPVLKSLFAINGHLIRVKKGETVIQDSTEQKAVLYQTDSHIIGFKVDVRLIYDHGASEFDIGAAEACLPDADNSKVTDDSAKLLREGKNNTDTLAKVTSGDIHNSWIMQMSGLTAYISTVNYVGDDLYVGVSQNTIVFPSCVGELNDQAKSLEFFTGLFQFRDNIENSAQAVKACILRENKTNTNINTKYRHSGNTTPPNSHQPSSQTWYTPPRKQQKRSVFPTANYELLNTGQYVVVGDDDIVLDDYGNENAKVDEFGLVKLDSGWYHPRLKKHFDQHPGR